MTNQVVISTNIAQALTKAVEEVKHDKLFLLMDETTHELCFPVVKDIPCLSEATPIIIGATDTHKTLDTLAKVWTEMGNGGGTRHSLMVNLGGGMVTDLGGFAASTFKRGIKYINVPTTLLSMVDASVGGKTGINFNGLKNEVGVFNAPKTVIIDTEFLKTLDHENILSGYAEMLKHGLISNDENYAELLNFDLGDVDYLHLGQMVGTSVAIKGRIWGLICELYLSCIKTHFPTDKMRQTVRFIKENYGTLPITCDDYEELYGYMTHDKKNTAGIINFTLLGDVGDILINQSANKEEIFEMLDFFREG